MTFPKKASGWRTKNLLKLNIRYNDEATDLSIFMAMLSEGIQQNDPFNIDLSEEYNRLIDFMNKYWNFSFDFDIRRTGGRRNTNELKQERKMKIQRGIADAKICLGKLQREDQAEFQKPNDQTELKRLEMYYRLKYNLQDFLTFYLDILKRWDYPSHREGKFSYLFILFTKICLLSPQPGETYLKALKLRNEKVSGIPDVRFITQSTSKTVAVTEVKLETALIKKKKSKKPEKENEGGDQPEPSIFKKVAEKYLSQHGVELLIEKDKSVFRTGVAGFLCIGTKVFFTFLKITENHFSRLKENGQPALADDAKIFYTEPFDFMQADEREKIFNPLYRLGLLQSLHRA